MQIKRGGMKAKKARKKKLKQFSFRPGFRIGAIDARQDLLLERCFVSVPCYSALKDLDNPCRGIIGRSGTGKTALLERLKSEVSFTIKIDPEELAFPFISGSDLIKALRSSHISLDYFYKLLWRHVFVVEILKFFFPDESKRFKVLSQIVDNIKGTIKPDLERKRAIEYLGKWGSSILQAPQERIREICQTLEKTMEGQLKIKGLNWNEVFGLDLGLKGSKADTTQIKENIRIATEVINQIQVQNLNAVKKFIGTEIVNNRQKPCYILIDDLDRFWSDDPLVYELIRALILEIYDWSDIKNVKIIFVLRDNILHKIETDFKSRVYQKEKLEGQRMRLRWTRQELTEL